MSTRSRACLIRHQEVRTRAITIRRPRSQPVGGQKAPRQVYLLTSPKGASSRRDASQIIQRSSAGLG